MYIVDNYLLAIIFCFITMLCWGSWGNTQKLASKTWRYEYFYWDYVFGIVLCALFFAFTLGSHGENGRSFLTDLRQADFSSCNCRMWYVGCFPRRCWTCFSFGSHYKLYRGS